MIITMNLIDQAKAGDHRHPAQVLRDLGITYEVMHGHPIADMVKFFGCKNVPDNLPTYVHAWRDSETDAAGSR